MLFEFLVALLFVILFSIVLELIIRNPYIVAGIVAIIFLLVLAINFETLGAIFAIWIVIYTIVSLVTAFLTNYWFRRNHNSHRNHDNDCF